jgi:hypothetical protein
MGIPATSVPIRPSLFSSTELEALMGTVSPAAGTTTPDFASQGTYLKAPPISIECRLYIEQNDNYYSVQLNNVKFDSYDMSVDSNAIVLENVSFVAESIEILKAPINTTGEGE